MKLNDREFDYLLMLCEGLSHEQMAARLGVNASTMNGRAHRTRQKLRAKTAAHAISIAYETGILKARV